MFFVVMLSTSFEAMRFLSVPMITVFKQLANLLTVSGEYYLFGKTVSFGVILSFFVMISGAVLAAVNDLEFSLAGYMWQSGNCVATSGYVLYLKHATQSIDMSKFGVRTILLSCSGHNFFSRLPRRWSFTTTLSRSLFWVSSRPCTASLRYYSKPTHEARSTLSSFSLTPLPAHWVSS